MIMAPPRQTRRRSPGEGGAFSYKTKIRKDPADTGIRWYWKAPIRMPDGTTKIRTKSGFATKDAALTAMREAMVSGRNGEYVEPSKRTVGSWLDEWLETLRLSDSTVASYRKNIRLHVKPSIGDELLSRLTSARLTRLYRELEAAGRRDGKGELTGQGLSARTVRYIHTIIGAALAAAVHPEPPLLPRSPAAQATPPTAKQAASPEMHPWNASQLQAFLGWSKESSSLHAAWRVLAMTGMRRGELLALRWRHVDLDGATISIQRTVGIARIKGDSASGKPVEGPTKTAKSRRVIDIDPGTVALLRAWKRERGGLALALARDDALVFSSPEGGHMHPE